MAQVFRQVATAPPVNKREYAHLAGLELGPGVEPVPGYRLLSRIGAGSTGEVWKALGPGGFLVALKFVVKGSNGASDELYSLSLMKDIRHANLLTIFGTWELDGLLVVGMDLADGTLLDRCGEAVGRGLAGIPFGELATYMEQAARGVDFLNRPRLHPHGGDDAGLLHRDIKPQNLLLVGGSVKVGDFGLVASLDEPAEFAGSESLAPAYIPPEWAGGRLSGRSDQYALAMTYCRLSAGRLPSPTAVAGGAPSPGGFDLSMTPESQRPVVARALARDPDDRWPDCLTFVQELVRVVVVADEETRQAHHPEVDEGPTTPPPDRSFAPAGAVRARSRVVVAGLLIVTAFAAGLLYRRPPAARATPGLSRLPGPARPRPAPAPTSPESLADGEGRRRTEVVADRPPSPVTRADVVATVKAMTVPVRGKFRHALAVLRRSVASLERRPSAAAQRVKPVPEGPRPSDPAETLPDDPFAVGSVGPPADLPTGLLPDVYVSNVERPPLPAAREIPVNGPGDPAVEDRETAGAPWTRSKPGGRGADQAPEAPWPRAATITVLLPNANAELVVKGDVGKGNPDEWYGPKRVIHSPPLGEAKDYLVGAFWTDQDGRRQTRATTLKVNPGKVYEVNLRSKVPTAKEVDRASLFHGPSEKVSP